MRIRQDVSHALFGLAVSTMALAWLVPNHYPPWTSYYNELCMGIGLLLLLGATAYSCRPQTVSMPWVAAVVVATAVIPWLQWMTGLLAYSSDAWVCTLYLFGFATSICLGHFAMEAGFSKLPVWLAGATLAGAVLSAVLGLVQSLEIAGFGIWLSETGTGARAAGNLAQSNNFATLLAWGLVSLLYLYERRLLSKMASGVVVLVLLIGLGLSQSRTGLAYGPVALLGLWLARRKGVPLRTSLAAVALITAAWWLASWSTPRLLDALLLTPPATLETRGSGSIRFVVWPVLADALQMKPWQGYGWLQVGAAQLAAADRHGVSNEMYFQAHNFFFELVIWMGYPIGLGIGVLVVCWFTSRWLRVRTVEATVGMLIVAICGVHGMLEFPYQYAYFLVPMGLWIGIVEQQCRCRLLGRGRWVLLLPAVSLCLLVAICFDYHEVEDDFRLVRFELLKIGSIKASQPAPDAPFLSSLTAFLEFTRTTPSEGMSDAVLAKMGMQVNRYPYAGSLYRYSVALALNGRTAEAVALFAKMRQIHGERLYTRMRAYLHELSNDSAVGAKYRLVQFEAALPKNCPVKMTTACL